MSFSLHTLTFFFLIANQLPQNDVDRRLNKGDLAPDFSFYDLDSTQLQLSSLKSDFIIVDFWASWCKPCRVANAKLVRLYEDSVFRNRSEIVSISLDHDSSIWRIALRNDQIAWKNQLIEVEGKEGKLSKLYGVKSLPQLVLMNGERKIIAINPTSAFLKETILNAK